MGKALSGMANQQHIHIGISQNERLSKYLSPQHIKIDGRDTADMLAFVAEYAKLIRYYNHRNNEDGDWSAFFINDVSVFLSIISITDLEAIREEEQDIVENIARSYGLDLYRELYRLFQLTHRIISMLDDWYTVARGLNASLSGEPQGIEIELEHAIENELNDYFVIFRAYERAAAFDERLGNEATLPYHQFNRIWDMEEEEEDFMPKDKPVHERISVGLKKARVIYQRFYRALTGIVHRAKHYYLKKSTSESGHRAHVAMLITFVKLFRYAQEHLNEISHRHLDYYYRHILQQQPRAAEPDQVHLHFLLAEHIESHTLPRGTLLTSPNDDNITYATDMDLHINKVQIAELKTIFIGRNPRIGIGSSFRLVSDIYAAAQANSKDGMGKPFYEDEEPIWSPFGEIQYDKTAEHHNMRDAYIGFAIASPTLFMQEGQRLVSVTLDFNKTSCNSLNRLIKDISKNNRLTRVDTFHRVFDQAFNLSITTADGWLSIPSYGITQFSNDSKQSFTFVFSLDYSHPPIGFYPKSGFDSSFPILRIIMNPEATIHPYSFIKDLQIEQFLINVSVKDLKDLAVYNELGRLDASKPFQPFGPIPKLGSYLLIGNAELFRKEIVDFNISLEWFDLPKETGGFRDYYHNYQGDISNESFEVSIAALSNNKFSNTKDNDTTFKLFHTNETTSNSLHTHTLMQDIPVKKLDMHSDPHLILDENFSNRTPTGFIKLELCNPPGVFGHESYPSLFTKIIENNFKPDIGLLGKVVYPEALALPNEPYIPVVKSISIDYQASARINLLDAHAADEEQAAPEALFHIHPFGIKTTFKKGRSSDTYLMPQYNDMGNLLIGLEDVRPPQVVSFYFHLKENLLMDDSRRRPMAEWYFMQDGSWSALGKKHTLLDTTSNFTTSGIIQIQIPKSITKGCEWLNPNLHWLRIGVPKNVQLLAKCLLITTQGVSASRVSSETENMSWIKAGTLSSFVESRPNIRDIFQPYPSFGGRMAETGNEFHFRVAERLRHKGRAVAAWDYERLVLERFPEIHQVKCIPICLQGEGSLLARVQVVVVPKFKGDGTYLEPKADYYLLENIKDFLNQISSTFAQVEVINPIYERLKISCGVVFTKGNNNGTHLKMLNQEIRKFINPWMFGINVNLNLGGTLVKDELLSAIRQLPYVRFVTRFSIVQVVQKDKLFYLKDTARDLSTSPKIMASTPHSVLIPIKEQPISFLEREAYQEAIPASVDTLMVGTDFVIRSEDEELAERADYYIAHFMESDSSPKDSGKRYFINIPLDFDDED